MAFSKLILSQIVGLASNSFLMDLAVDKVKTTLIEKTAEEIESKIPIELPISVKDVLLGNATAPTMDDIKGELLNPENVSYVPEPIKQEINDTLTVIEDNVKSVIEIKNNLFGALNTLLLPIATLEDLSSNLEEVVVTVDDLITILQAIPLPLAVPPGAGLPANVVIGFADGLASAKTINEQIKGPVSTISPSIAEMRKVITPIIGKLLLFDGLFMTITTIIIFIKLLLLRKPGEELTDSEINDVVVATTDALLSGLVETPGPIVSNSTEGVNALAEAELLNQLQPGSNDPLIYKGYLLTIEYDPNNQYSFPLRRIKGTFLNINEIGNNINRPEPGTTSESERLFLRLKDSVIYNLKSNIPVGEGTTSSTPYPAPYSYSSSVQVLISEIIYEIDRFIAGKESLIINENAYIIFDVVGLPVGFNPLVEGRTLSAGVVKGEDVTGRDQDAIDYVESLGDSRDNPSTIFDNYRIQTERRSWVYDVNKVKVGRIPGKYGVELDYAGYGAIQYLGLFLGSIPEPSYVVLYPPTATVGTEGSDRNEMSEGTTQGSITDPNKQYN
tara:strand:- start:770 stop:2443 length:1674 start_codon:yes stop_codon:yes gene_type:complete